eukprot:SM000075S21914  [mRNA]  locus=s75:7744:12596:+ [translate_table: standard]
MAVVRDHGLLLTALLSLSAFFSMAETSITTLWPWKVRELAEKETEGGTFQLLRQDVTRFLTTILIGTTVVNIAATALVTEAATLVFGEAGVSAATAVMTVLLLLFTEIAPKSIAVHNATEVARVVVRPVAWLSVVLYPVGRACTALSMALLKLLGLKSSGEPFVSEEELKLMLRGAELSGAIEEEEQDMIENVLDIKDTYVREVMTPLVDMVAIDSAASLLDFHQLWTQQQYSRVPVFERRVDNIVGLAYTMDMLDYVDQPELLQGLTVGRIAHRPAYFVPDSMSVWNLLREFRIRKVHMAIVLNEYGGSVGLVTLEDVVEEIVGEIFDENDSKEEIRKKTGYLVQRSDGVFDVDASTSIDDLAEALDIKIRGDNHYETVSGFVCEAFGYIPRTGDTMILTLTKADEEDERRDDEDGKREVHEERRHAAFQKYKLEILAGNARKVGSVRFERQEVLPGSDELAEINAEKERDRERERAMERNLERERSERGIEGREVEKRRVRVWREEGGWEDRDTDGEGEDRDAEREDGCYPYSSNNNSGEPKAQAWELQSSADTEVSMDGGREEVGRSGGDGSREADWNEEDRERIQQEDAQGVGVQSHREEEGVSNGPLKADRSMQGTLRPVGTRNGQWEEKIKQVERRRQRRTKERSDASEELDRHRRDELRRRDGEEGQGMEGQVALVAMAGRPKDEGFVSGSSGAVERDSRREGAGAQA